MNAPTLKLVSNREADGDLFPAPYVSDSPELTRTLSRMLEKPDRPRPGLGAQLASIFVCAVSFVGLCAMLWGATVFMIWALGSYGRPA